MSSILKTAKYIYIYNLRQFTNILTLTTLLLIMIASGYNESYAVCPPDNINFGHGTGVWNKMPCRTINITYNNVTCWVQVCYCYRIVTVPAPFVEVYLESYIPWIDCPWIKDLTVSELKRLISESIIQQNPDNITEWLCPNCPSVIWNYGVAYLANCSTCENNNTAFCMNKFEVCCLNGFRTTNFIGVIQYGACKGGCPIQCP